MRAVLTITVAEVGGTPGLLASMSAEGDFADESMSRRFYSFAEMPPADLPPYQFWGTVCSTIGGFLQTDE